MTSKELNAIYLAALKLNEHLDSLDFLSAEDADLRDSLYRFRLRLLDETPSDSLLNTSRN